MDPMLSTAISFVISYIANCLPVPTTDYEGHLRKCFHNALDRWNVAQEIKDSARNDMDKYLIGLREIVTHTSKGRHPKECELLHLWADEILSDKDCCQFILANQNEILQIEVRKGLLKVDEVLNAVNQQKAELEKISRKVQQLLNRGVRDIITYWDMWATGPNELKLTYDTVLAGREVASDTINRACNSPMYICVESSSQSDAFAFVVATILKNNQENVSRAFVIDHADAYRDFTNESTPLIIITNVLENHNYAVSKGHSVIWCGTPADKVPFVGKLELPPVDRDGFRSSLKASGLDDGTISNLILDTKRESSLLRRALGINCEKEEWMLPNNNKYYIPAILLGSWDEKRDGDKQLVEKLSGLDYASFDKGLQILYNRNESPLYKVGSVWQVSSPRLLITRILSELSGNAIDTFKECLDWILEDDDPDILAKRDSSDLRFWQDKHLYSEHIRGGLLQSLTILAVVMESQGISVGWVDQYVASKLKEFSLERFLSNKHNLRWIAESSPCAFLDYLEEDVRNGALVLKKVFEVKHTPYSLTGSEIYFSELLFCLEGLAWEIRYLPRVSALLLEFCRFPNDSNYSNKPSASLYNIYRFLLPQTLVPYKERLDILRSLANRFPEEVSDLCFRLLDGIKQTVFMPSSHFRWRYSDQIKSPDHLNPIPAENVTSMAELLLSIIEPNEEDFCKLIDLATNDFMRCCHDIFLNRLHEYENLIKGNEVIVECLRKNINQHLCCKGAAWALSREELNKFQDLLAKVESDDIIIRNKHFFADYLVKEPDLDDFNRDFSKKMKESRIFRKGILAEIVELKGWDSIWEMTNCVGNVDGLAEAVIELTDTAMIVDVYRMYCSHSLNRAFVLKYYRTLFYEKGVKEYLHIIDELKAISNEHIGIVLYAPDINKEITKIVDCLPDSIQKEYWENVGLWGLNADLALYAVERLRGTCRYSDLIRLVQNNDVRPLISNKIWLEILFEVFGSEQLNILFHESYYVAEILKEISVPEDANAKSKLMLLELMLFDHLRHHLRKNEFHLSCLVNTDPSLMMELVQLAYLEDKEYRVETEMTEVESKNKQTLAQLAWNFFYHYHDVPGMRADGTIDGDFLKGYLIQLQKLSEICHRTHVMPLVIGRILGNFPEREDYPSDLMCELIELFNNDDVDSEIGCCLSNRRGMSSRSPYAGGDIERSHIETFKKYQQKAMIRSPRLAKILESEIKSFEYMAAREDERGKLADLNQ